MTDTPGTLEERLRVPLPEGMCGQSMGCNAASICLCSHIEDQRELLTEAADEIASLRAQVEALETAGRYIKPYLVWTVGPESPGCHPTMPSAVGAFLDALAPAE